MPDSGRLMIVAGLFARLLDVAGRCGLDRQQLLAELGIEGAALEDRDNRLPAETFARFGRIVNEAAAPELIEAPVTSRIRYGLAPVFLATQHAPEAMMVSLVAFLRSVA